MPSTNRRSPRMFGNACSNPCVYGWAGPLPARPSAGNSVVTDASSTSAARVHDRDAIARLGQDREVVRDEDHRQSQALAEVAQQRQDLRLCHDVERGDRLVGQHQLRPARQAPSRSSRAAACRPRARAGSRGARSPGMPTASSSSVTRPRPSVVDVSFSCRRIGSRSWSPMRCTGFRAFIAPWKTTEIFRQRSSLELLFGQRQDIDAAERGCARSRWRSPAAAAGSRARSSSSRSRTRRPARAPARLRA